MKPREVDWKTYYRELWKPMTTKTATEPRDGMPLAEFVATRGVMRKALEAFERVKPTCHTCAHFEMGDCLKHGAPVPADFQAQPEACPDWAFDGIPF